MTASEIRTLFAVASRAGAIGTREEVEAPVYTAIFLGEIAAQIAELKAEVSRLADNVIHAVGKDANARLIAAAPELYEELNCALAVMRSPESFYVENICERVERLLARVSVPRATAAR